jgi:hypothetical protein
MGETKLPRFSEDFIAGKIVMELSLEVKITGARLANMWSQHSSQARQEHRCRRFAFYIISQWRFM